MGQRKNDPHGKYLTGICCESSKDWTRFNRVNPVIHWKYKDIWHFLKRYSLDYCTLYVLGYTS